MRWVGLFLACLLLCTACATQHQLPQTERQLQGNVIVAEDAYMSLYTEHKANRFSKTAMTQVNTLYNAWRNTHGMLIDAVRSGVIQWAPEQEK